MKKWTSHPAFPYALPLVAFFVIHLGGKGLHPLAQYITYPIATAVCTFFVFYFLRHYEGLLEWKKPLATIGLGILAAALWIIPYEDLTSVNTSPYSGFNPGMIFESDDLVFGSIAIRLFGFAVTVPLIEEIFWRGFLQRYLINPDFKSVRIGSYTHYSYFGVSLMIVLAHSNQLGVAIIWALLSSTWFIYTKSVGTMVLLHAVTNLTLGIYVVVTESWYFW